MLKSEDIPGLQINTEATRSILAQAEKYHADLIDDKKLLEAKAASLFGSYIAIATALFGAGSYVLKEPSLPLSSVPFFSAGSGFIVGSFVLVAVQQSGIYGISGSYPNNWIDSGWMVAPRDAVGKFEAYLVLKYVKKIDASLEANEKKRNRLQAGMYIGVASISLGCLLLATHALGLSAQSLWQLFLSHSSEVVVLSELYLLSWSAA